MKCKYCGAESPDVARFCCACGRELFADGVSPEPPARYVREVRSPESQSPVYTDFAGAIGLYFRNYANFSGRSTRSEYWYAFLFTFGIRLMLLGLEKITGAEFVIFWSFATFLPEMAISCRRLHDIGKTGTLYAISYIPAIIWVVLSYALAYYSEAAESSLISESGRTAAQANMLLYFFAWLIVGVILLVLSIYLIVLYCKPSQPESNRYGRAPY